MESRNGEQEATGARWIEGQGVKKSEVATRTTNRQETVTLDDVQMV